MTRRKTMKLTVKFFNSLPNSSILSRISILSDDPNVIVDNLCEKHRWCYRSFHDTDIESFSKLEKKYFIFLEIKKIFNFSDNSDNNVSDKSLRLLSCLTKDLKEAKSVGNLLIPHLRYFDANDINKAKKIISYRNFDKSKGIDILLRTKHLPNKCSSADDLLRVLKYVGYNFPTKLLTRLIDFPVSKLAIAQKIYYDIIDELDDQSSTSNAVTRIFWKKMSKVDKIDIGLHIVEKYTYQETEKILKEIGITTKCDSYNDVLNTLAKESCNKFFGKTNKSLINAWINSEYEAKKWAISISNSNSLQVDDLYKILKSKPFTEAAKQDIKLFQGMKIHTIIRLLEQKTYFSRGKKYDMPYSTLADTDKMYRKIIEYNPNFKIGRIRCLWSLHNDLTKSFNRLGSELYELPVHPDYSGLNEYKKDNWEIRFPKTNHQLMDWGIDLANCMGSYAGDIRDFKSVVFTVWVNEHITWAVEIDPERKELVQFYGANNFIVDNPIKDKIVALLKTKGYITVYKYDDDDEYDF